MTTSQAPPELPKTFKAMTYDDPGKISTKMDEHPLPEPEAGQVLIHLTHSGVCHSDMSIMTNGWKTLPAPTAKGQVGGHEGVGRVVKLGQGAETHLKMGDRVGIKWMAKACGGCNACLTGHDAMCTAGQISGYYTAGTFQQYVCSAANYVTPIPDNVDSAAAAPLLCGGVTVYSALRKCGASPGQWVAIMGAGGGLGDLATQIASKGMGFRTIGVDHSSKKDFVIGNGAEHFVAFDQEEDVPAAVQKLTDGIGAHAVLVLTASNKAYEQALMTLRFGGRLMIVGVPDGEPIPIASAKPIVIVFKELSIVGSAVGTRMDAINVLEMAGRGVIKSHFRVEKMDKLQDVFEEMEAGKLMGRVVLDLS